RKVAIVGRSMRKNLNIAGNLGYLDIPEGTVIQPKALDEYEPHEVLILCTGSQGEPMSALTRIAYSDHAAVSVERGDTVILSARGRCPATSSACTTRSTSFRSRGPRCCTRRTRRCTSRDTPCRRRSALSTASCGRRRSCRSTGSTGCRLRTRGLPRTRASRQG